MSRFQQQALQSEARADADHRYRFVRETFVCEGLKPALMPHLSNSELQSGELILQVSESDISGLGFSENWSQCDGEGVCNLVAVPPQDAHHYIH